MSSGVGGTDGNQININTRKPLNLAKLDKLIGKSTAGSVWAEYDSLEKGGNANSVFDSGEINAIKTYLLNEENISADMLAYFEEENAQLQTREPKSSLSVKDTPPLPMANKTLRIIQSNLAIHSLLLLNV